VPVGSNAEAAQRAAKEKGVAAIAARAPSARLKALARSIEDDPNNTTRFLVLAARARADRQGPHLARHVGRTSPGGARAALAARRDRVSMTRIESRPRARARRCGSMVFFIDVEGHQQDEKVSKALDALKVKNFYLKILGCTRCRELKMLMDLCERLLPN